MSLRQSAGVPPSNGTRACLHSSIERRSHDSQPQPLILPIGTTHRQEQECWLRLTWTRRFSPDAYEEAAIQAQIDRMQEGMWSSEVDMKSALRARGYHVDGPLGELYRHVWQMKSERTQQVFDISGNNRVIDPNKDSFKAVARRNKDGEIESEMVHWSHDPSTAPV